MKISRYSSLTLLLSSLLLFTYNAKSQQDQPQSCTIYTDREVESLYGPIVFSAGGVRDFFQKKFNVPEYAQKVLPNDFTHMIQLLERSVQMAEAGRARMKKARAHAHGVLRVFKNKVYSCSYVNAYVFESLLKELLVFMTDLTRPALAKKSSFQDCVYNLLYKSFSNNFSLFKKQPQDFLSCLSCDLVQKMNENYLPDGNVSDLKAMLLRFLEVGIGKLVWNPRDGVETWRTVRSLGDILADFVQAEVIKDTEDLNDLYIALVERYVYFLDLSSAELDSSFYSKVLNDISSDMPLVLELDEQEDFIEPKCERISRALRSGSAKAYARKVVPRMKQVSNIS